MCFGLSFQTPDPKLDTKASTTTIPFFINDWQEILSFDQRGATPCFYLHHKEATVHREHTSLLTSVKLRLTEGALSILSADKGPVLILIPNLVVDTLYSDFLNHSCPNPLSPDDYIRHFKSLKHALTVIGSGIQLGMTDERCPSFYFKIKSHKPSFQAALGLTRL